MSDHGKYLSGRDYWNASIIATPCAQTRYTSASITSPYGMHSVDLTIMVAACENEDTIRDTLQTILECMDVIEKTFEIIIIDDASKDKSAEIVREFISEFPELNIVLKINHKRKGCVLSYIDGAFIGQGKYYRMVYGDHSESMETMVDALRPVGEADILVPYYLSMHPISARQRFNEGWFSACINRVTGHRMNLYSGLHVHLRYNVMRWRPCTMGSTFQTDLLCQLLDYGFTCKQVPCRNMPVRAPENLKERLKHTLSAGHTLLELLIRAISCKIHD